ncbi:MAG: phage regulatory CII family protein [Bacteroidota bacterium]
MKQNHSQGFRHDEELIGTLVYVFITQKRYDILKLSQQLGMEYADLYAFVSGRRTMPITLLKRITELTGDRIFFDTVFAGSNIVWNFKKHPHQHTGNPVTEALDVASAFGKLSASIKEAMNDGKISGTERIMLIGHIANLQQEVQDLLESAKAASEA